MYPKAAQRTIREYLYLEPDGDEFRFDNETLETIDELDWGF